jgi:hypothetical protein
MRKTPGPEVRCIKSAPVVARICLTGALLLAGLGGCGIPQFVVLEGPQLIAAPSLINTVSLEHDTANDTDDFLGYEIFYKFYDPSSSSAEFIDDSSAVEAAGPGILLSVLRQRDFYSVSAFPQTSQRPAIRVSATQRAQDFTFDIIFPDQPDDTSEAVVRSTSVPPINQLIIRDRSIGDPEEGFAPADVNLSDVDVPDIDPPPSGGLIDMAIVVVAYGVDFTNGTFAQVVSAPLIVPELLEMFFE